MNFRILAKYTKFWAVLILFTGSVNAYANTYNTNSVIQIKSVVTYIDSGRIYIEPKVRPAGILCAGVYFHIKTGVPEAARQNMMSRLLLAYTTGEQISIGYDNQTCDPSGYIAVFRLG